MNVTFFNININSHQPEVLKEFYGSTLGFEVDPLTGGYAVPGAMIHIDGHSEITAATSEPARVLINFMVENAKAEREALEAKGVTFIRKEGIQDWGGIISTFLDPDGNYLQVMEYNPEMATADASS